MVFPAILGSIAGSIASAGASKLLGGGSKAAKKALKNSGYVPFSAGGISGGYDKNGIPFISSSGERSGLVNNIANSYSADANNIRSYIPGIQSAYGSASSAIGDMIPKLDAGYGDITKARVQAIQDAGRASGSDLRSNLARRRVTGSSFGNDAIARNQAEFAKQESDARARSYLEELDAKMAAIDTKLKYDTQGIDAVKGMVSAAYAADRASSSAQLDEMNTQLNAITSLLSNAQNLSQRNAEIDAQYAREKAGYVGNLASGIGSMVSGWGAGAGLWGGYDPSTGITWNSGR